MSTNLVYSYEYGYAALMQQVAKSEISKYGEGLILFKFYKLIIYKLLKTTKEI